MAKKNPRYRFVLLEDPENRLPVLYRPPRPITFPLLIQRTDPLEDLIEAFLRLSFRGEGEEAWAPALAENPLLFLLDTISDAVVLRLEHGNMLYANPAARNMGVLQSRPTTAFEKLRLNDQLYERRCMSFSAGPNTVVLEVLRRVRG